MKKYIFVLVFACALLLTGCGSSDKLVCTYTDEEELQGFGKTNYTLEFLFNEEGFVKQENVTMEMVLNDETFVNNFAESLKNSCEEQKDNAIKCDVSTKGSTVILYIEQEPDDTAKITSKSTKEDVKENLESIATCK